MDAAPPPGAPKGVQPFFAEYAPPAADARAAPGEPIQIEGNTLDAIARALGAEGMKNVVGCEFRMNGEEAGAPKLTPYLGPNGVPCLSVHYTVTVNVQEEEGGPIRQMQFKAQWGTNIPVISGDKEIRDHYALSNRPKDPLQAMEWDKERNQALLQGKRSFMLHWNAVETRFSRAILSQSERLPHPPQAPVERINDLAGARWVSTQYVAFKGARQWQPKMTVISAEGQQKQLVGGSSAAAVSRLLASQPFMDTKEFWRRFATAKRSLTSLSGEFKSTGWLDRKLTEFQLPADAPAEQRAQHLKQLSSTAKIEGFEGAEATLPTSYEEAVTARQDRAKELAQQYRARFSRNDRKPVGELKRFDELVNGDAGKLFLDLRKADEALEKAGANLDQPRGYINACQRITEGHPDLTAVDALDEPKGFLRAAFAEAQGKGTPTEERTACDQGIQQAKQWIERQEGEGKQLGATQLRGLSDHLQVLIDEAAGRGNIQEVLEAYKSQIDGKLEQMNAKATEIREQWKERERLIGDLNEQWEDFATLDAAEEHEDVRGELTAYSDWVRENDHLKRDQIALDVKDFGKMQREFQKNGLKRLKKLAEFRGTMNEGVRGYAYYREGREAMVQGVADGKQQVRQLMGAAIRNPVFQELRPFVAALPQRPESLDTLKSFPYFQNHPYLLEEIGEASELKDELLRAIQGVYDDTHRPPAREEEVRMREEPDTSEDAEDDDDVGTDEVPPDSEIWWDDTTSD